MLAPRARFELATLRLAAETAKNLSALSRVAYKNSGAIFPALAAPNPAPKTHGSASSDTGAPNRPRHRNRRRVVRPSEVFGHPHVAIPFCAQDGNAAVIG